MVDLYIFHLFLYNYDGFFSDLEPNIQSKGSI